MKLIKVLFALIVALVIANITLTNRGIDEGVILSSLSHEIAALQDQNTILKGQVAKGGAIGNLTSKLTEAGFTQSPAVVSLSDTTSVASR